MVCNFLIISQQSFFRAYLDRCSCTLNYLEHGRNKENPPTFYCHIVFKSNHDFLQNFANLLGKTLSPSHPGKIFSCKKISLSLRINRETVALNKFL